MVLDTITYLQGWLYLEPIFGSEDILQQMPNEGRKFRAVDATWRRTMAAVRKAPEVLLMCSDDELLKNLVEANKFLEQVLPPKKILVVIIEASQRLHWACQPPSHNSCP